MGILSTSPVKETRVLRLSMPDVPSNTCTTARLPNTSKICAHTAMEAFCGGQGEGQASATASHHSFSTRGSKKCGRIQQEEHMICRCLNVVKGSEAVPQLTVHARLVDQPWGAGNTIFAGGVAVGAEPLLLSTP